MTEPFIKTEELSFGYDAERMLFRGLNLEIRGGEIVALCGASGCGKSTLCYCLSGIIPKIYQGELSGRVMLFGEDVASLRLAQMAERLFFVFQEPSAQLFSPTIEDELVFAPENMLWSRERMEMALASSLEQTGIGGFRYLSPNKLSGGEQQMVTVSAALVAAPRFYIFDEAVSQLDEEFRQRILQLIVKLKNEGNAVLMVEHSYANMEIADRVLSLENGILTDIGKK